MQGQLHRRGSCGSPRAGGRQQAGTASATIGLRPSPWSNDCTLDAEDPQLVGKQAECLRRGRRPRRDRVHDRPRRHATRGRRRAARSRRPRGGSRVGARTRWRRRSTPSTIPPTSASCGRVRRRVRRAGPEGRARAIRPTAASTAAPTPSSPRYGLPMAMTRDDGQRDAADTVTTGARACRGSGWRTRCTGRSCAPPARRGLRVRRRRGRASAR